MDAYTISTVQDADAEELARLINSAYRGETSRQGWTTEADLLDGTRTDAELIRDVIGIKNTTLLKLEDVEKGIVGCVELRKEDERMYMGMLTVKPGL
jgi:hypothetical protein